MTTVAFDGFVLASDRQGTAGNRRLSTRKIWRVGRFWYAQTGSSSDAEHCKRWLAGGAKLSSWPQGFELTDEPHGMVIDANSYEVYVIEGARPALSVVLDEFSAFGSGCDFAMLAMTCGKNAIEAVQLASQYDIYTGCGVDHVTVRQSPRKRKPK